MSTPLKDVLLRLRGVKPSGEGWIACCPAHPDTHASMSIAQGQDGRVLLHCHTGCSPEAVADAVGLTLRDLFPKDSASLPVRAPMPNRPRKIVGTYGYRAESGTLLFEVIRHEPKAFHQRKPDGDGGWIWGVNGVRKVPYRLPDLLEAIQVRRVVFVVEGEKDADRLHSCGLVATCNAGGAGNWTAEHSKHLRGARVTILPDNDEAGRKHGHEVAAKLYGIAAEVRVVELPDLPAKGDVSDWLEAGGTIEQLKQLVRDAPTWTPPQTTPPSVLVPVSGLTLQRIGDMLAEPEEETEWLVEGMLPAGGLSLLVSKPKVGKSTLARTLALAVARGASFLGSATAAGPVLHLALEEKRAQLIKQYRALGAMADDQVLVFAGTAPKEAATLLQAAVALHRPALVLVDTVQRLVRVREGNDYSAVSNAFDPILAIAREYGAHLMLLHHSGKGDREAVDAAIGSTAWAGSVDTILYMKRREDVRTLTTVQRYGEDLPETVISMDGAGRIEAGGTRHELDVAQAQHAIAVFLRVQPGATQQEIRDGVEGHRTAALREAITALVDGGEVRHEGHGKKGDPHRYFLVPENSEKHSGSQDPGNQDIYPGSNQLGHHDMLVPAPTENSGNQHLQPRDDRDSEVFEI